jgi:hypothetical protein
LLAPVPLRSSQAAPRAVSADPTQGANSSIAPLQVS